MSDQKTPEPDDVSAEVERLRSERDQLQRSLDRKESRTKTRRRVRRFSVGFLVFLSCLLVAVTTVTVWTHWLVLNSDHFASTVAPLPSDPAVAKVLSQRITTDAFNAANVQQRLASRLPPNLSFIAGPVANAAKGYVTDQVNKVLRSPRFQQLLQASIKFAHEQALAVLRGRTNTLSTKNGVVTLNLIPIINGALQQVQQRASDLIGKQVSLPTITSAEPPPAALAKLSSALGVQLPTNFGQIVVFRGNQLEAAQKGMRFADRVVIALPILTLVLIALALWLSVNRRRTIVQLLTGSLVALVVVRVLVRRIESDITALGRTADGRAALKVIGSQVFHGMFTLTMWMLIIGFFLLAVTLVTGPYGWAVSLRKRTVELWRALIGVGRRVQPGGAVDWIRQHHDLLQIGGAVAAIALLLILGTGWTSFLVIGALLLVYELILARIGRPAVQEEAEEVSTSVQRAKK